MARKYLDRKDPKDDSKNNVLGENSDPLDQNKRTIVLNKNEPITQELENKDTTAQINKAEKYMHYINSQLADRLLRIEKIKQSHENFEKEIEMLHTEKAKHLVKRTKLQQELINEPESVKATRELSNLIQQYAVEKLDMMKQLFDSEKQQSTDLHQKLQENLTKISVSEEKLKQQRDELELEVREKTLRLVRAERLSAIGELSARLAHDLRNPLTVIKGVVEIAKSKISDNDETSFNIRQIEMMERAVLRMSHQIDDVLEFVKIQTLRTSRNSLLETVGLSVAKIKKTDKLSVSVVGENVDFVYDADKLEVVFDNLLQNAIQSCNYKGNVTIRIIEQNSEVAIEFEDSGKGVPADILPKIFEPLFTTKTKGTGLGLASCKSIIEQHGGNISVISNPSMFTVRLPKLLEISTI